MEAPHPCFVVRQPLLLDTVPAGPVSIATQYFAVQVTGPPGALRVRYTIPLMVFHVKMQLATYTQVFIL